MIFLSLLWLTLARADQCPIYQSATYGNIYGCYGKIFNASSSYAVLAFRNEGDHQIDGSSKVLDFGKILVLSLSITRDNIILTSQRLDEEHSNSAVSPFSLDSKNIAIEISAAHFAFALLRDNTALWQVQDPDHQQVALTCTSDLELFVTWFDFFHETKTNTIQ